MQRRRVCPILEAVALASLALCLAAGAAPKSGAPNEWAQPWMVPGWFSGTAEVAVAVTHQTSTDTYTYNLKNVSFTTDICQFTVPGQGCFLTASTSAPPGWTVATIEDPCGMGTWWTWTASQGSTLGVGETAVFSVSLPPSTWECAGYGGIVPCMLLAAAPETGELSSVALSSTPAACHAQHGPVTAMTGCTCFSSADPSVCVPVAAPSVTALGTRMNLRWGPQELHITSCEPFWIMHGFIGERDVGVGGCVDSLGNCDLSFDLYIDGVLFPLAKRVIQFANGSPGVIGLYTQWFAQFPSGFFDGGTTHTLTGVWTEQDCGDAAVDYQDTRTITLIVDPCPQLPGSSTPASLLLQADLLARILTSECGVRLDGRMYKLDVSVWAEIENVGSASATSFHVLLDSPAGQDELLVSQPLAPGEKRTVHLQASSDEWICCCYPPSVPCPESALIEVTADNHDELTETSEENNTAEDVCPCS